MRTVLPIAILLCFSVFTSYGQDKMDRQWRKYLVLKKGNKNIAVYEAGDKIHIKKKDSKIFTTYDIKAITDEYIITIDEKIWYTDIFKVKAPHKVGEGFYWLSGLFTTAGIYFLAIEQFNKAIVFGEGIEPDMKSVAIGSGMVGAGVIFSLLPRKKFRITSYRYRLHTTDFVVR